MNVMDAHATCVRLEDQISSEAEAVSPGLLESHSLALHDRQEALVELRHAKSLSAEDVYRKRDVLVTIMNAFGFEDPDLGSLAISVTVEFGAYFVPGSGTERDRALQTPGDKRLRRTWLPRLRVFG